MPYCDGCNDKCPNATVCTLCQLHPALLLLKIRVVKDEHPDINFNGIHTARDLVGLEEPRPEVTDDYTPIP